MNTLTKRDVLLTLAALTACVVTPARAQSAPSFDLSGGRAIGEAYLAAHPETNVSELRAALLPHGFEAAAIHRLRARAAADFSDNRLFIHQGWRLSQAEGQLFALLAVN